MRNFQQTYNKPVVSGFINEFKTFALRGNVVDLAIAVVIGAAFGQIVSSLVDNIIMPLASILLGGASFRSLAIEVGEASVTYGIFLQSVIDFIVIAFAIFLAVKVLRTLQRREEAKPEEEKTVEPTEEVKILREIRDNLKHS